MNALGNLALKAAIPILQLVFSAATPWLRKELEGALRNLYAKALATPNPLDDFGVRILCQIVNVDLTDVQPAVPGMSVGEPATVQAVTMPETDITKLTPGEMGA